MPRVTFADLVASHSFGIGNRFTSTRATWRAGDRVTCTFILTDRGSTSGIHRASGGRSGIGRAVSEAMGVT